MFQRIWRAIDLSIVVSRRARQALMAANSVGVSMEVMYDGGLEVQTQDILPEFNSGKPPFAVKELCVVAQVVGNTGELRCRDLCYEPSLDGWQQNNACVARRAEDLWLRKADYGYAMKQAAQRAKIRLATQRG